MKQMSKMSTGKYDRMVASGVAQITQMITQKLSRVASDFTADKPPDVAQMVADVVASSSQMARVASGGDLAQVASDYGYGDDLAQVAKFMASLADDLAQVAQMASDLADLADGASRVAHSGGGDFYLCHMSDVAHGVALLAYQHATNDEVAREVASDFFVASDDLDDMAYLTEVI